jgi:hypothetical protein
MKRRTDKGLIGLCLLVFIGCIFYLVYIFAIQEGISRGYEEANSQNQRMAFSRAKALGEAAYRGELNQCKSWVDGLGADLVEARSIIREMR